MAIKSKEVWITTYLTAVEKHNFRVLCAQEGTSMAKKMRGLILAELKRASRRKEKA